MPLPFISGVNNIDTSGSRGSEITRQVKLLRRDMQSSGQSMVDALKEAKASDSPYVADRKTIDKDKIHGSPNEGDWRKVEISSNQQQGSLASYSLKKLNII